MQWDINLPNCFFLLCSSCRGGMLGVVAGQGGVAESRGNRMVMRVLHMLACFCSGCLACRAVPCCACFGPMTCCFGEKPGCSVAVATASVSEVVSSTALYKRGVAELLNGNF